MVKKKIIKNQTHFGLVKLDYNIPEDHISRFLVEFVEEYYDFLKIPDDDKKCGRASFPVKSMLKLLVYATLDHKNSAKVIAEMVEYHMIYIYVCDGLKPSERTIQRYRKEFGSYYNVLL